MNKKLEEERFPVGNESKALMDHLVKSWERINFLHPVFRGVSYFGSRTLGLEKKEGGIVVSDLDLVALVDTSKIVLSPTDWMELKKVLRGLINEALVSRALPPQPAIRFIDLNPVIMMEDLRGFMEACRNLPLTKSSLITRANFGNEHVFGTLAKFLLHNEISGSAALKDARKMILEAMNKESDSERLYAILIGSLQHIERPTKGDMHATRLHKKNIDLPKFEMPKTIEEAMECFVTNPKH